MHTTDSAWFWLLLFSGMALVALMAMERRYGQRQSQIERQFQGREHALRQRMAGEAAKEVDAPPVDASRPDVATERSTGFSTDFSTADNTVIELAPLRYGAVAVFLAAAAGLAWEQRRNRQLAGRRKP